MVEEDLSPEEKRELRRKRKIRNLIISYISLVIFLLVLIIGGIFGGKFIFDLLQNKTTQEIVIEPVIEEASLETEESMQEVETEVEVSKEDLLEEAISSMIAEMTIEEKVAGLFIVTPEQLTAVNTAIQAGNGTKTALEEYPVGGLIYFQKNIQSESQITEMIENTISYSKFPLFIAVDEEGGNVTRVASALKLENVGDMQAIGETNDEKKAYEAMTSVASYLAGYGFNLNFAPVADVLANSDNTSIGDRSFGSDAELVSKMVVSAMTGLEDGGVTAVLKHFPGLGESAEDTHEGIATTERTLEEMRQKEFLPFIAGIEAGANMIMVGHISMPNVLEDNTPASISKEIMTDVLRVELGFQGVIITDALNMGAITEYYAADEIAIKALKAGADMILMPEDFKLAYKGIIDAVKDGTISEERINDSLTRVYRIKYADSIE
ncbi:MAG: glycoside hydrolase family 3 N-terminal domain-containing protein [Lachnospiraceae bacterium]